ncbi:hypothetical protein PAESOLCIP111_02260 [Paenibacillus solanacearum]|uniref:YncE family protein n=1 Tax=Paenibacillus solanacearum TaxID=2048548 RepID=A0A916K2E4_9BACL|nr:YncE family protein [Paenibacillus solanacearum]CAG7620248.1 hypothetical protein PAESOLCIP111_02260 [Paenibacillus solanacearum]
MILTLLRMKKRRARQLLPRVAATIPVSGPVVAEAVNSVTNRIYFLDDKSRMLVLDGNTNKVIATVKTGRLPFNLAVNPRTNRIYITNFFDGTVSVINGRTNRVIATVKVGERCDNIAVDPRANLIYVATISLTSPNGQLVVLNGSTNRVQTKIPFTGRPSQIVVNPAARRIYVTNTSEDTVSVIDGNNHAFLATEKVGRNPVIRPVLNTRTNRLYIANNLSRFYSVLNLRTHKVRNVRIGRLQSEIELNPITNRVYITSAQITSKGRLFAVNGGTNRVISTLTIPASTSMTVNPKTNHLFVAEQPESGTAPLTVYNGSTLERVALLRLGEGPRGFVLNPQTNRIYIGGDTIITVIQD